MSRPTAPIESIDPDLLLRAYAMGVFPMADARDAASIYWVEPQQRAVLPLDGFHLSRSLRTHDRCATGSASPPTRAFDAGHRAVRRSGRRPPRHLDQRRDRDRSSSSSTPRLRAFDRVLGRRPAGRRALRPGARPRLLRREHGVARTDASKVAIAALVARLQAGGFTLLDCQFQTDHLASLGAIEVAARRLHARCSAPRWRSVGGAARRRARRASAAISARSTASARRRRRRRCPRPARSSGNASCSSWARRRRPGAGRRSAPAAP